MRSEIQTGTSNTTYQVPEILNKQDIDYAIVTETLWLGLRFAIIEEDNEAFNRAISAMNSISYRNGCITSENNKMRTEIEWLRSEVNELIKELFQK